MLIRFAIKNLFSFKEETEFNLLPGRTKRLNHHKYERNGVEVLKLTALYGANGSGKSNLIRSISLLQTMLLTGIIPNELNLQKFKLSKSFADKPTELAIEFFANDLIYFYSVALNNGMIVDEYFSHNDEAQNDVIIFHRKQIGENATVQFSNGFEDVKENELLKKIIEKDLLKKQQPLFYLLNTISNAAFINVKIGTFWFQKSLTIIYPETKAKGLAATLDSKDGFKVFANNLIYSLNTGVKSLKVEAKKIEEYFGQTDSKEIQDIKNALTISPEKWMVIENDRPLEGDDLVIVNENGNIVAKRLLLEHESDSDENVEFRVHEESDGTRRLLEYLPAWSDLINTSETFIIDEIERSIHPLIIKELIEKFSKDESTKGQLIFSTHETNLLDQETFRTDEIWFTEKNVLGATKLYSLSDFKEHNTIDIRKGYLNGRYGAIPFLGNLHDLNWHKFQDEKE